VKKGINFWSFSEGISIENAMLLAKDAHFEGIELCLAAEGEFSLQSTDQEILAIKRRAEEIGIEFTSVASWLTWEYSLTSDHEECRCKAKEIARRQIETAALLATDTILLVPGYVGADFVPNSEVCEYDKVYDRALEAVHELAQDASKLNITIAVENVWNKFLLSPLEMRDFIDRIHLPNVGVYFDVGNVLLTGYPEHWIKILGQRIKRVHFKDYRREPGGFGAFVDLLAGDVNYPAVVEALKGIGYDSYCTAEMMPPYKYFPEQIIYNTSASMDRILKHSKGSV
jgi:L-ribulose-5-phosphate 3-epimerase